MKYSQWGSIKKFAAEGLCGACHKPRGEDGTTLYCRACACRHSAYTHKYRNKLKAQKICIACGKRNASDGQRCSSCAIRLKKVNKQSEVKLKMDVLNHYGNSKCACCGEDTALLLTIDHMNNDGNIHRKEVGRSHKLYRWLRDNNYPEGFQVLCFNCNIGKHLNGGVCPHKEKENA